MMKGTAAVIFCLGILTGCFDQGSQQEASQSSASTRRINKRSTSESVNSGNSRDATVDSDVAEPHEHDDAPVDLKEKDLEPSVQSPMPAPMPTPTPAVAATLTLVEFKIKAGTGSGPWNDANSTIKLSVGQTLKITNDDTVDHLLHTGGAPFAHARTPIKPGTSVEFKVIKAFAGPMLYDHITTGKVFIVAAP